MALHLLKYEYWQNGSSWYCGDVQGIGTVANAWYTPSRLLGLAPHKYIALLVSCFNANILGFNGKTLVYNFKSENEADRFCKYINQKAKSASYYL